MNEGVNCVCAEKHQVGIKRYVSNGVGSIPSDCLECPNCPRICCPRRRIFFKIAMNSNKGRRLSLYVWKLVCIYAKKYAVNSRLIII